jgi:hypothetical protein
MTEELRGGVELGAHRRSEGRLQDVVIHPREGPVDQLRLVARRPQDVRGRQIPMKNALGVGGGDGVAHLLEDPSDKLRRKNPTRV